MLESLFRGLRKATVGDKHRKKNLCYRSGADRGATETLGLHFRCKKTERLSVEQTSLSSTLV